MPAPRRRRRRARGPPRARNRRIAEAPNRRSRSAASEEPNGSTNDSAKGRGAPWDGSGALYSSHSLVGRRLGSRAERRCMWGESPSCEEDVFDVFERFVWGRVPRLPWCDRIEVETVASGFVQPLSAINHFGFLTINSQPRLDGAPSTDAVYGWGPAGGRVYQKAYLEFFCPPAQLDRLIRVLATHPSVSLQAYDASGRRRSVRNGKEVPGDEDRHVAAVTWGVFDSMEVLQPTVVDSDWFQVWSDDAFALWDIAWGSIYDKDSEAQRVLQTIRKTYWHAYVVDNDYIAGDIFRVFAEVLGVDPRVASPVIAPRTGPAA